MTTKFYNQQDKQSQDDKHKKALCTIIQSNLEAVTLILDSDAHVGVSRHIICLCNYIRLVFFSGVIVLCIVVDGYQILSLFQPSFTFQPFLGIFLKEPYENIHLRDYIKFQRYSPALNNFRNCFKYSNCIAMDVAQFQQDNKQKLSKKRIRSLKGL